MAHKAEPLTESYFFILLCLYRGPNHGYGIMQQALELSKGNVRIGSGTMYGATSNMMKKGWIEECPSDKGAFDRKRQYRLTENGLQALRDEVERLRYLNAAIGDVMGEMQHEEDKEQL